MGKKKEITIYNAKDFTSKFMPSKELEAQLKGDLMRFLLVRVEDMYRHVTKPVPASRSLNHSFLFVTDGIANMKVGSEAYSIGKGEVLFVPAGQVYSFGEKDQNKGYICHFSDEMLLGKYGNNELLKEFEFLRVWGNPCIRLDEQGARYAVQLFDRLLAEYAENGMRNHAILQPYLIALLSEVNRCYKPISASTQTAAVQITNRFKELIFSNIRQQHLVSNYAAMLNISPNHLNKSVKAITQKSPTRWIDEAIVLEAKVLLSQSQYSISEVAVQVGFDDQSYFTRLFRKYEGMTPTEFRKMIETS
jgi:AraC family transcriptional regulator, transcriptional activator of pobA